MKKKTKVVKGPDLKVKVKQLNQAIEDQDWLKADEQATKLLLAYPNNWEVLLPAAEVKFQLLHEGDALKFIERAVKSTPTPDQIVKIAIDRLKIGELTDSEAIARAVVDKYHKCLIGFEILAISLKRQGKYSEAIEVFKKALAVDKKVLTVWMNMGNAYMESKKYDEAVECFKQALVIHPNYAEAARMQGSVYIASGKNMEAITMLSKAASMDGRNMLIKHDLAVAYHNVQNYSKAMEVIREGLNIEPNNLSLIRIGNIIAKKNN